MAERDKDKMEPFWARPSHRKRGVSRPLNVPPRDAPPEPPPAPKQGAPPSPPAQPPAEPPPAEPLPAPAPPVPPAPLAPPATLSAAIAELSGKTEADLPREPSFPRAARRDAIAAIIHGGPVAPPEPRPDGWIDLSPEDAERHPLFGIQGWPVPLAILVALGLFRALVELIDFWQTTDHGGLAAWIMAMLRSAMALWAALILGLLLGRSRAFPTNFAAYASVEIVYLLLFGLAFAHVTQGAVFVGVGAAIALNIAAIAYVVRSRRVNVTFRNRVKAKDYAALTAPPSGAGSPAASRA